MTAEIILNYTPEQPFLAASVLLLLYALKSVTVVFPISALQLVVGHLFEPVPAFLLNLLGLVITLTLPYFIGKKKGAAFIERKMQTHPHVQMIAEKQKESPMFLSFFLRVIGCLPGDLVSMYLGACRIPYPTFLLGGLLGSGLHLIAYTILGNSISTPGSPQFWISLVMTVILSVGACLIHKCSLFRENRHKKDR